MKKNELIKITDKEYFSANGLSSSGLKQFAKSPAHYQSYLEEPSKSSTAFNVGTLTHGLVLEGRQGWATVKGRRVGEVKQKVLELEEQGIIAIKPGEDRDLIKMSESVKRNQYGKYLGKDPQRAELAGFAECPQTGLLLKAKFDYAPSTGNILFDLKTAQDASPNKFKWSAKDFGYDIQAVHYMNVANLCGMDYEEFIFVVVEKKAPYLTSCYRLSDEMRERAESKYRLLLESFKDCKESNDFSQGYTQELIELDY